MFPTKVDGKHLSCSLENSTGSQEQQQFDAEVLASVRSQESVDLHKRWPGYGKCLGRQSIDGKYTENQSSNMRKMTIFWDVMEIYPLGPISQGGNKWVISWIYDS